MNADGIVEVRFGGAHLNGNGVALSYFASIRTQVVETDNAIVVRPIANQLRE